MGCQELLLQVKATEAISSWDTDTPLDPGQEAHFCQYLHLELRVFIFVRDSVSAHFVLFVWNCGSVNSRDLCMLSTHAPTELHPSPATVFWGFFVIIFKVTDLFITDGALPMSLYF